MSAVIVGAADENFFPRLRMGRAQDRGALRTRRSSPASRLKRVRKVAQERVAQTIDTLKMFEEQDSCSRCKASSLPFTL